MDKINVLMLNYEFPPLGGGAANATNFLLKELSGNNNLNIDLITSSTERFKIKEFSSNVRIHYLDIGKKGNLHYQHKKELLKYSYSAYQYAKKMIKKRNYNLCHAFFGIPCGYIAMKLKKKFNIPYIVSLRGSDVPFYNERFYILDKYIFQRLSRKIWQQSYATITNSEGLKKLALQTDTKKEISVIHNGVDVKRFFPVKSPKNKKMIVVSTGRLIERKGYRYLIPAIKDLPVELKIIGDGNLINELKEMAIGLDVEFLGNVEHEKLAEHLQSADLFVLPSLNEGMSNSVLEALASGLPVILTDVGGSDELVDGNGVIVKKGSIDAIREGLTRYINNPELIEREGIKSREIAEKMSWGNMADKYKGIYNELA